MCRRPSRGVRVLLSAAAVVSWHVPAVAGQPALDTFRVFLTDGRILNSHGECATLPEELVCVVKLGGGAAPESHDLLTVPLTLVDQERTREYARALRAAAYGATRGEREYAELTAEIARALRELETSTDRDRRLGIAQVARRRLATWSDDHFGYKAGETRQLAALFDGVIAELRLAAGERTFSLDLVANLAAPASVPLLPSPGLVESIGAALAAAEVTPVAAERLAILRSAARAASSPDTPAALRNRVIERLAAEEDTERRYRTLMNRAMAQADLAVRRGRPVVIEELLREVAQADRAMGWRRPREMAAFARRLGLELASAQEQQAAFAHWSRIKSTLFAYEVRLRPVFDTWASQRAVLDALRARGTIRPSEVDRAARRFRHLEALLAAPPPLPEVESVHALLRSAVQMARQGLLLGGRLTVARNTEVAANASAAVAGADLLLTQARADLIVALNPRRVR